MYSGSGRPPAAGSPVVRRGHSPPGSSAGHDRTGGRFAAAGDSARSSTAGRWRPRSRSLRLPAHWTAGRDRVMVASTGSASGGDHTTITALSPGRLEGATSGLHFIGSGPLLSHRAGRRKLQSPPRLLALPAAYRTGNRHLRTMTPISPPEPSSPVARNSGAHRRSPPDSRVT